MPKGYSLHIGVNKVDASKYEKEAKPLASCINDANAMADIALQKKYTKITILRNKAATKKSFVFFMEQYAQELEAGDIFLLSFSGHGMQMETIDPEEEEDAIDEGWCFYDGFVRDKSLFEGWKLFKKGVRIVLVSDSCYSGDVYRFTPPHLFQHLINEDQEVEASCLLMASSQELETSDSELKFSHYTKCLLRVWEDGKFSGNYNDFEKKIKIFTSSEQNPVFVIFGNPKYQFDNQSPFEI